MNKINRLTLIAGAVALIAIAAVAITFTARATNAGSGDGEEPAITGDALQRASQAALASTGGGTVTETEVGDEESYYEVEVTLDDGSQVDVQLDQNFNVVGSDADEEDDDKEGAEDEGEDAGEHGAPITGDALQRASDAALASTSGGTVTETEVGDEESYYEVEVTLDDGSQVDVQLDETSTSSAPNQTTRTKTKATTTNRTRKYTCRPHAPHLHMRCGASPSPFNTHGDAPMQLLRYHLPPTTHNLQPHAPL